MKANKFRLLGLLTVIAVGVWFTPDLIKLGDVATGFTVSYLSGLTIYLVLKLTKVL